MTEPLPKRTIFFSLVDYELFEQRLEKDSRSRFLFIQGRKVVDVDCRSTDSRDMALCVGRFSVKTIPHYEGLIGLIHKVAIEYEKTIFKI